ncbi:MAG TPA: hypothetical protein VF239_15755 [Vicinamibacterales bacterium]|jgi:chemotaxis response regulator CheB
MIRIALIGMRPKLRSILSDAIAREKDMRIVQDRHASVADISATTADVLVCEVEEPDDATTPTRLLHAAPGARVLMIAANGDRAAVFELRPACKRLLNVSMDEVIDAIRRGLGRGEH